MHPDVGAIIGISLAGSALLVAILFLCFLHIPCCTDALKPVRNRSPSSARPSMSSRAPITRFQSFAFAGSTRDLRTLSAIDLNHQNAGHFYNGTGGIVNPVWQLHCSCEMLAATNQANSSQHQTHCRAQSSTSCQCSCCHNPNTGNNGSSSSRTSSFQYHSPQLVSADSPPPYPGLNVNVGTADSVSLSSANWSNPPPYSSPKH